MSLRKGSEQIKQMKRIITMKNYKLERFYKQNRFAKRAKTARKRSLKLGLKGYFTRKTIENLYVKQCGKCACCGERLFNRFEVDHIKPLSKSGDNVPENLQLLKPNCNRLKGDKSMQEFLRRQND